MTRRINVELFCEFFGRNYQNRLIEVNYFLRMNFMLVLITNARSECEFERR